MTSPENNVDNINSLESGKNVKNTKDIDKEKKSCSPWCWPLIVYIAISVISIFITLFFTGEGSVALFVFSILLNLFWAGIMFLLCKHCHPVWAWFLLLLPLIITIIFIIVLLFQDLISVI